MLLSNQAVVPSCLDNVIRRQAGLFPVENHRVCGYMIQYDLSPVATHLGVSVDVCEPRWPAAPWMEIRDRRGLRGPRRRRVEPTGSAAPMGERRRSLDTHSLQTEEKLHVV